MLLLSIFVFHRKLPPNSVPPSNKFIKALTASRPKTEAMMTITPKMMILFLVKLMFSLISLWKITLDA